MEMQIGYPQDPAVLKAESIQSHGAEEEIPKLTDSDRLSLFGGDKELLAYYLGIREATAKARRDGNECFCDPRDTKMIAKLKLEDWRPRVLLKDLKDEGESREFGLTSKQTALDEDAEQMASDCDSDSEIREKRQDKLEGEKENQSKSFVCGVQGCSAQFTSLASHESHYHTSHNFVCHVCRRAFVSNFLLDIHLEENHDSYFQVLSPRVDMYRCLVESCSLKFRTAELRKDHLVKVHKFPAPFSFHGPINHKPHKTKSSKKKSNESKNKNSNSSVTMDTSDSASHKATSSLSSLPATNPEPLGGATDVASQPMSPPSATMEVDPRKEGVEGATGTPVVSANCKRQQRNRGRGSAQRGRGRGGRVPATICFGRGSQRAFQHHRGGRGRHWHQTQGMDVDTTVDIEKVDFADMAECLEG